MFFLFVPVEEEDCFKDGNYDGGPLGLDIDVLDYIDDAESCQMACQVIEECLVWTYDEASQRCYRQSGPAPMGTCTTCTHGPKFCEGTPMPPNCILCSCDPLGSANHVCDTKTGDCECNPDIVGSDCSECGPNMWGFPNCEGTMKFFLFLLKVKYFSKEFFFNYYTNFSSCYQNVCVMKMDLYHSNVTEKLELVLAEKIFWIPNVHNVLLNIITSPIANHVIVILMVLSTIIVMLSLEIVSVILIKLWVKIATNVQSTPLDTLIVKVK